MLLSAKHENFLVNNFHRTFDEQQSQQQHQETQSQFASLNDIRSTSAGVSDACCLPAGGLVPGGTDCFMFNAEEHQFQLSQEMHADNLGFEELCCILKF